jgi:hypothetical protein
MTSGIECPACGSPVASGRLSCPACGAILAAVRSGPGDARPVAVEEPPTAPSPVGTADRPAADITTAKGEVRLEPPPILGDPTGPAPSSTPGASVPGSYLPPSAIYPARRPEGARPPASEAAAPAGSRSPSVGPREAEPAGRPSALTLRALGEPAASWLVLVGSALGLVAFLLPWSPNGVIGSPGDAGYLGRWGLANAAYGLVMAAAFGCLAVQVLETRLPAVLRDGILPLALGGFLLGLAWTYVAGPFGADLGVQATILGGVLLVVGGSLGVRAAASRSAEPPPS